MKRLSSLASGVVRAVTICRGKVEVRQHPDPVPGKGELLVKVKGAGINGADILQVKGGYPAPPGYPPDIPGMELAGEVAALGEGVQGFTPGDRVMAVVGGGAQAELAVVHERTAIRVPGELEWAEAGGFPEVFTTAYDALFTQCGLTLGERALVHGAAGGVGSAGVQLAHVAGASVTATVRRPEARVFVESLGADRVVGPDEFEVQGPFDVILELVGAPCFNSDLRSLAIGGRISVIGIGGGSRAEIELLALMASRGRVLGSTLRSRPLEAKADAAQRVQAHVLPLLERGRIRVPVAARFSIDDAQRAYDLFQAGGKLGKVVLEI